MITRLKSVKEVWRPGLFSRPVSRSIFAGLGLISVLEILISVGLSLVLLRSRSRSKQSVETTET